MAALIDTHLHLYRHEFDGEREQVLARARRAGVGAFLHIGYNLESNASARQTAADVPGSWATAGVHPHDAATYDDDIEMTMRGAHAADDIIAIGECGLDYFRDLSPRDVQAEAFRKQIRLAKELDLPMIHHVRDAYADARAILEDEGLPPRRGIFHAFAGDREFARWAVDQGYKLGIGGVLTYKKAHLPDAIAGLPADALQLETDAPWLPPQPWRGKRNEPGYLRHTAEVLTLSLGLDLDALSEVLAGEFEKLFGVELPSVVWESRPSESVDPATER